MKKEAIHTILSQKEHRSFPYPSGNWAFYQEWSELLFLHWRVPYSLLRELVPKELSLDHFNGDYYISLVPFSMKNVHPRFLPAFAPLSNFHEINLRTYIDTGGRKGVYFLSIEAQKWLSTKLSGLLSGMPYEKAEIVRSKNRYKAANVTKNNTLDLEYRVKDQLVQKTALDSWLTERYCLFLVNNENVYRYDVHHLEWMIKPVELKSCKLHYRMGKLSLHNTAPELAHYSDGVQVLAWMKRLDTTII